MRTKKVKQFLKNKVNLVLVLLLCVLILTPIVTTTSRFVISKIDEHYLDSKEFYFNSSVLNGSTYNLYNWDGSDGYQITFDTTNSKDSLNWTKHDIEYEILTECTSAVGAVSCSSSGDTVLSTNSALITNGSNTVTLSIGNNEFTTGDTVTINVTAKSISPYKKELTASFIVKVNKSEVNYYIEDMPNRNYLNLIISNNNESKDITVDIDASLLSIDNTNYYVNTGVTSSSTINDEAKINRLVFRIESNNVYNIRFYKSNPIENYTLNTEVIQIS